MPSWFQYPVSFNSKQEVVEHWQTLIQRGEDCVPPERILSQGELDVVYAPGHGWRYAVSLASPSDSKELSALGDEFVHAQSALFEKEFKGVDHKVWCEYLGLQADLAARRKANENVARNLGKASRFNFQALCHGGCTLKCEAFREVPSRVVGKQSVRGLPGSGNGANGANGSKPPARPAASARSGVVGFVHFCMEESQAGSVRTSKRLMRKRGEASGEYTKISHLHVTKSHWDAGLGIMMLTAMLHRVVHLEPNYARELFLTVIAKNERAVGLYGRLGMSVIGSNTTFLGKERGAPKRPVEWHQMVLRRPEPDQREDASQEEEAPRSKTPRSSPPSSQ